MPMKKNTDNIEHFNLYYIFLEDKNNNLLSPIKAEAMRINIFEKPNNI